MKILFLFGLSALFATSVVSAYSPNRKCVVKHNGVDDSPNIMDALEKCKDGGRVVFNKGKSYKLGAAITSPVLANVDIIFDGDLTYPFGMKYNDTTPALPGAVQSASTFFLIKGKDITVSGSVGSIYGSGEQWWHLKPLPSNRPTMMAFMVENLNVQGLRLINSPGWNFYVHRSKNVRFEDIYINDEDGLHGEVPHNTDGWDTSQSDGVTIVNSYINNGDDYTSNIHIENLYCNGSHGISVGSLGNIPTMPDYVSNLYVKNVTCDNCENGARIKTWAEGALGYVQNVSYIDFKVSNTDNPILIDQCYFNLPIDRCKANPSLIKIVDATFENISGTGSKKANLTMGRIVCSAEAPCENFHFSSIDLTPYDPSLKPVYICANIGNNATAGLACTPES